MDRANVSRFLSPINLSWLTLVAEVPSGRSAIVVMYWWGGTFAALWLLIIFGPELLAIGTRIRQGRDEPLIDQAVEAVSADISPSEKNVWYDDLAHPMLSAHYSPRKRESGTVVLNMAAKLTDAVGKSQYRYSEETIYPGERLYAIGLFKTFGETDRMAMREEMIKERLSQWKADHASLLARFDRDGDGKIDITEWEVARRAAKREVTAEQLQEHQPAMHTLSRTGSTRRPFLISSHAEFNLVRRFRYAGFAAMGGFFLSGSCALWIFTTRYLA